MNLGDALLNIAVALEGMEYEAEQIRRATERAKVSTPSLPRMRLRR